MKIDLHSVVWPETVRMQRSEDGSKYRRQWYAVMNTRMVFDESTQLELLRLG